MNQQSQHFECHIKIDQNDENPVEILHKDCGLSKQRLKQVMQKGAVWLSREGHTRRVRRANKELKAGDQLHMYYDDRILQQAPAEPVLIADEGEYSIWFKPYGVLCQGSKWGDHCTIQRWVEVHGQPQRPVFIVHRLDRAATGIMILAHSKKIATAFSNMFSERRLEKHYRVIVEGQYPQSQPVRLDQAIDGKPACSHLSRIYYDRQHNCSLLEVKIETGRKHQIRRHCTGMGFPVLGDRLYGGAGDTSEDLQLCAWQLEFECPVTNEHRQYQLDKVLHPQLIQNALDHVQA